LGNDIWIARRISRREFLGVAAAGAGVAFLGACGGGGQGGGSASGPIQVTTQQDIPHTDPAVAYDVLSWPVVHAVFTTLITYNESAKGFVPWVATSVPEPQNDGKKYVFTLRKGIKFTNGEPVDASAFKYEIERILDPETKSAVADFYTNIVGATDYQKNPRHGTLKGVKVLSPTKIEFDLLKPNATFLQTIAIPPASAVPRKAVEKAGPDFDNKPVGSGPFKVETFQHGSKLILVKNKDYFDESTAAKSNEIDITIGLDPTTEIQRVQQGSADYAFDFPSSQYTQLKDNAQYKDYIIEQPINTFWFIYMNMTQKPWTNPKVREAMQYAIDKDRIVQVLAGRAYVTNQILPPKVPGYDDSIGSSSPYDPDKARALLEEAGYTNGFSIEFWDQNAGDEPKVDQVIQQNLSDVGIEMDLHSISFSEWIDKGSSGQTQTGVLWWSQDYPDPQDFLDVLFNSNQIGANNWGNYSNPTVDKELAQALSMENQSQRLALYQKIQKLILADNPIVPLWNDKKTYFRNPDIQGTNLHPVWYQVYQDWYRK
jgi:oligopeptide transport system substrate-binding protein